MVGTYLNDRNLFNRTRRRLLIDLVKFTQLTLTDPRNLKELKQLAHHFGLHTTDDWEFLQTAVIKILEQGIDQLRIQISYEDMIWLPNILDLPMYVYDFLCVDEAQDLSLAQLEIVMKAHKAGARGIFVGDTHQAIMGFAASDNRSISKIIARTKAIEFPLSICYRCPNSHIELANEVHRVIIPREGAPEGIVEVVNKNDLPELLKEGDLVICRCFYPLIPLYFALLQCGKSVLVRKKDISFQLINLLSSIVGEGYLEFTTNQFRDILITWYEEQKAIMEQEETPIMTIVRLHDKIQTLNAIYQGNNCTNTESLIEIINKLGASDEPHKAINLTTIHGAKGLEANRVFHLRPDLVPHHRAEKDWEQEQEYNLLFVALTRAKEALFFARK